MNKVIKIHGCSGAGKTTLVRAIMSKYGAVPCYPEDSKATKPEAYETAAKIGAYILGSYENVCGGMDTISDVRDALKLIDKYYRRGHVIHEGLLQSTYYGVMGEHSKPFGQNYIYAFLNTPVEVCITRIMQRRADAGNTRPWDPNKTREKHKVIDNLRNKVSRFGHHTLVIPWDLPVESQVALIINQLR
jgi:adenylate kinase family enzyme